MIRNVKGAALIGLKAVTIDVECFSGNGLPQIKVVGMAESVVRESLERVRAAVKTCGYSMPPGRIIINLSPSEMKKDGTQFDLPIALGMVFSGIEEEYERIGEYVFLGELSLTGRIVESQYLIPLVIELLGSGVEKVVVPGSCKGQLEKIRGLKAVYVDELGEAIDFIMGMLTDRADDKKYYNKTDIVQAESYVSERDKSPECTLDFGDVTGLHEAKRAIEIACCGRHNILLTGSPGIGKSMLLSRVAGIMPDMSYDEALSVSQIYRCHGIKRDILDVRIPVRSPSITISQARFTGGFSKIIPGEVSLAHRGILIMNELSEFKRDVLSGLRDVMDTGNVYLKRDNKIVKIPSDFMLMATTNPCKCGFSGTSRQCTCSLKEISDYMSRLNAPLLDRIDIKTFIISEKEYENLTATRMFADRQNQFTSEKMKGRIQRALDYGQERNAAMGVRYNSELDDRLSVIDIGFSQNAAEYLENIFASGLVSGRSQSRIARISRTIADFESSSFINESHVNEALDLNGAFSERRAI